MKKIYLMAMMSVSLLIWSDKLQAQTSLVKLNQIELMKQFISNWKGEVGKDTTAYWEIKSNGTELDCSFKFVTKGKTIMEGKQLWDYDKKVDKFILSSITSGMDFQNSAFWFTSKSKSVIIPVSDISNPEKAPFKLETEFKSPDTFVQKTIVNNNLVKTVTFFRVKN